MRAQRNPNTPFVKSVRSMTKDDLELLRQPSARPAIKNLRDSHHIIARLIASGLTYTEIASKVGYSISRISLISKSPAMIDLISRYRSDADQSWRDQRDEYYSTIFRAGNKAWRQIDEALDRADEENEPIPLQRLIAIADSSADRVGYNKKSTTVNINVDFAAKLEAAIARSRQVKTIELEE